MPTGDGSYGTTRGRPPKKKKKPLKEIIAPSIVAWRQSPSQYVILDLESNDLAFTSTKPEGLKESKGIKASMTVLATSNKLPMVKSFSSGRNTFKIGKKGITVTLRAKRPKGYRYIRQNNKNLIKRR
jgi:hypothetical protein|tara:strand:- start:692 stop:1072 length:381 start_codon:yes stop_codon:yes gene_type:complete